MPYVLQVIYSKVDSSEKPLHEMDNFPEEIKAMKEEYRKTVLRPVFKKNQGTFRRKTIGNTVTIFEYIFETEMQARNFYDVLSDESNPFRQKVTDMIRQLPAKQFSLTERSVVFKGPNGEILSL
jgi:hypothetical protein